MANFTSNFSVEMELKPFSNEQKLWRAVVGQALYDALSQFENKFTTIEEKKEAIDWFTIPNEEFNLVAENAGFNSSYLRKKFAKVLNLKRLKKLGIIWNYGKQEARSI